MNIIPVPFRNNELQIFDQDGNPYIPMRPIVEGMGLDWKTQYRKLMDGSGRFSVVIMTTQIPGDDQHRKVVCIPLRKLFGWLMTISPNKVKPEIRASIIAYQNECDDVLWRHWTKNHDTALTKEVSHQYSELSQKHWSLERRVLQAEQYWMGKRWNWAMIRQMVMEGDDWEKIGKKIGRTPDAIRRIIYAMCDCGFANPDIIAGCQLSKRTRSALKRRYPNYGEKLPVQYRFF